MDIPVVSISCTTCTRTYEGVDFSSYTGSSDDGVEGRLMRSGWTCIGETWRCPTCNHRGTKLLLASVRDHDQDYEKRYWLVLKLVLAALSEGLEAGFRIDPSEPEWPVAFIELPTGQVSWHMPQHPKAWDGHTTEEKFQRIEQFLLS